MELVIVVEVGGETLALSTPTVQEVREVKRWTGFASKGDWFSAIIREDADALLAAYVIAKRRKGERADYDDATDFPADTTAKWTDGGGREVRPILEENPDGTLKLDPRGNVIPVLDEEGNQKWRDAESGNVIPFEKPTKATTPQTPTPSGATGTGTQSTESA